MGSRAEKEAKRFSQLASGCRAGCIPGAHRLGL